MIVIYESPTTFAGERFTNRERLPVFGGALDGATLAVPTIFEGIVPAFARVGMDMYQLLGFERRWRFSFTISRSW